MSDPVIRCVGTTKSFDYTPVLRDIDLEIPSGSIVGLLGTNGCGKSTLIKCLMGLLKIESGNATIFNDDVWDMSAETKSRIGYVPQEITLYPWMQVSQLVRYISSFYEAWDKDYCVELLNSFELSPDKTVKSLSGGQLQRLALVLALSHRPELLVLDEPVAALDPVGRRQFLRSLLRSNEDQKQTVLFSTHITSDLERVASHAVFLEKGKVSFFGEIDDLKERTGGNLEDIFLEMHHE